MNKLIPVEILLENGKLSFEAEQILKKQETDDSHHSSSFDDQVKRDLENWMNNTVTYENYVCRYVLCCKEQETKTSNHIIMLRVLGQNGAFMIW